MGRQTHGTHGTRDTHEMLVGETLVAVVGETGLPSARWRLVLDGREVDDDIVLQGQRTLSGRLRDGSTVQAEVHQSVLGPAQVNVFHDGVEVRTFLAYVA